MSPRPGGTFVLAIALASGCAKRTETADEPQAKASVPAPGSSEPVATCGDTDATLPSYEWIPTDARMALSLQRHDGDLDAALTHLAELRNGKDHGVPITLTFVLAQLGLNLRVLGHALDGVGFAPAELVLVLHPDGSDAWVWHSTCDVDESTRRLADAWTLEARRTEAGTVASPAKDSPGFPFDVLFLPGELVAFVPAGKAARLQLWLAHAGARVGPAPDPDEAPSRRLAALEAAPVRAVTDGKGLVPAGEAGDDTTDAEPSPARSLRATKAGVEINGRLWRKDDG